MKTIFELCANPFEIEDYFPPRSYLPAKIMNPIDELHRNTGAAIETAYLSILVGIALASQYRVVVVAPYGSKKPCSIYVIGIADSGERKSSTFNPIINTITSIEDEIKNENKERMRKYECDHKIWGIKNKEHEKAFSRGVRKGLPDDQLAQLANNLEEHLKTEPIKPKEMRLIYSNATLEAVLHGLCKFPSAGLLNAEDIKILNERALLNFSELNQRWDAVDLIIDRVGMPSVAIKNPKLTCGFITQEKRLNNFIKKHGEDATDMGVLARFLFVKATPMRGNRYFNGATSWQHFPEYQQRLKEIVMQGLNATEDTEYALSPEATQAWTVFQHETEQSIAIGGRNVGIHAFMSKLPENALRLACLIHHFINKEYVALISAETMNSAIQLCKYFEKEFYNLFAPKCELSPELKDAETLIDWLCQMSFKGVFQIRKSHIRQTCPYEMRDVVRIENALNILQARGQINIVYLPSKPNSTRLIEFVNFVRRF